MTFIEERVEFELSPLRWRKKKQKTTPAGFEPAPENRNRFLVCRFNHSAIAPWEEGLCLTIDEGNEQTCHIEKKIGCNS